MHSTAILLEKMGLNRGCWNGHSSTTPDKMYHNTPHFNSYMPIYSTEVLYTGIQSPERKRPSVSTVSDKFCYARCLHHMLFMHLDVCGAAVSLEYREKSGSLHRALFGSLV